MKIYWLIALMALAQIAVAQWTEPVPMDPQLGIGAQAPWISNDNLRLYACSPRDLYVIERIHPDSAWREWRLLPSHIMNTPTQRSPCESPSGDTLYFMSASRSDVPSYGGFDIYFTIRTDTGWGPVFNAGPQVNSDRDEYSVGISRDGSLLLIASRRLGTFGANLYYHEKESDGNWGPPNDFGPGVNDLDWSEEHPTLYPGNERLVFSRDSPILGDLWESRKVNGLWQAAIRLPEPINGPGMTRDEDPCIGLDGRTLWFRKGDRDYNYQFVYSLDTSTTSIGPLLDERKTFSILNHYPNPFNSTTTLSFSLSHTSPVSLTVFNVLGQAVYQADLGMLNAGEHRHWFDATELPSGVYVARVQAGEVSQIRKMVLLK